MDGNYSFLNKKTNCFRKFCVNLEYNANVTTKTSREISFFNNTSETKYYIIYKNSIVGD